MYVCMYVCMHVRLYMCVYLYTYTGALLYVHVRMHGEARGQGKRRGREFCSQSPSCRRPSTRSHGSSTYKKPMPSSPAASNKARGTSDKATGKPPTPQMPSSLHPTLNSLYPGSKPFLRQTPSAQPQNLVVSALEGARRLQTLAAQGRRRVRNLGFRVGGLIPNPKGGFRV